MIELLPDQQESLDKTISVMQRGVKYIFMQGATGSGKSYIGSAIVQRAMAKNKRVWFTVPRKDLLYQMANTFNGFGISYSHIAADHPMNPHAKIHLCSAPTLGLRLDKLQPPHLALIDESHYGGDGLDKIISWLKASGAYIIFLSATPWKLSGEGLKKWADEMVCGPSIRWLIDNKRLSEYRLFAPNMPDLSNIKISAGDYAKGALSERMEQDTVLIGSAVDHYKKHAFGKLGVTFAVSRKHSELLAQSYRDKGIVAVHVDGETPMLERFRIFKAFARREIMQLCNAELLGMGFDISAAAGVKNVTVQSLNDCQPTKSLAKQMQKWGRGFRYDIEPHSFFDHAGNAQRHDLPCADRVWTLEDREKKSRPDSERTIATRSCPQCYFVFRPVAVCPACKLVLPVNSREVEQVDGELEEITATYIPASPEEERKMYDAVNKMTLAARKKGMPYFVAKKWAVKKYSEERMARK